MNRSLGVLLSLPIINVDQGAITRAEINIEQTRTELARVESRTALETRQARLDLEQSLSEVRNSERNRSRSGKG